ncbi:beta-ketoacyl synthase N-terminal-like domain-containing protein [Nocardia mexicana]|uniref:3-oxoacyl-[acyl-carrier-protein] synthase II n=1 Tax=Nocardia mexicana TaxID=279262 RepID=A0A370GNF8_9NOCA|nr:beta-ketoacyl synthase N-terminal-like domain-containing protein [Nocardia mexicana]RDI45258.1 3-oxoacyl-[acyl-carrier-protein] synthase II [Nocardia mexicana]
MIATAPLAITGCGVVSPAGTGMERLAELLDGPAVTAAAPAPVDSDTPDGESYPPISVHMVPEIALADHVGRKGTRRLDRMVGHALIASRLALASAGRSDEAAPRSRTGVAVGTSTGSIRSLTEIATDTLTQDEPYNIAPSRFPNTVLNSCAGQIAIWNSLGGVNSTLAGGHVSSTSALRFAHNAIRHNHATSMLVGGIEELSPQLAWAWHRSGVLRADASLGEGCALLVAEHPEVVGDRRVLAELLGTEVGYFGSQPRRTSIARGLAARIERLLARGGVSAAEIDVVSLGGGSQIGVRGIEEQAVRIALGFMPERSRITDVLGECFSAGGALQAAALLARWDGERRPSERHALVTSLGRDGTAGCFLLRRTG